MKKHTISISYTAYQNIDELNAEDKKLITAARKASENAWAPYSNYYVGAAVLLEKNRIVIGNNQENAAYPSGLCAERVALFAANANYPSSCVKAIAVTASNKDGLVSKPVKPCGACRQAMAETEIRFEKPIKIILDGASEIIIMNGVKSLLPFSFDKNELS